MKKGMICAALVALCFLLQSTLFSQFRIGDMIPNLLVIAVSALSFLNGKKTGVIVGFFSGMLVDIMFGQILGFYALLFMYIGYTNGMFKKIIFPEDIKLPLLLIIGSDFFYNLACYFFMFLLRGDFHFPYYLIHIIIPEMVYTSLIACVLYPLIHMIFRRVEESENKGEQNIV